MLVSHAISKAEYRVAFAQRAMPKRVTYSIEVGANVNMPLEEFAAEVGRVLADARGWRKYGYEFYRVLRGAAPDVRVRLETAATARSLCGMAGFSCQRDTAKDIIINYDNWMGKSASSLPLDRYRNYCISHEIGHLLGLGHQTCPISECRRRGMAVCPGSVMQQMTRGAAAIAPCIENDWPLDPDWVIDDPSRSPNRLKRSSSPSIAIIIVICIIALCIGVSLVGLVGGVGHQGFRADPGPPRSLLQGPGGLWKG